MNYRITIEKLKDRYISQVILENGVIIYINADANKQQLIEDACDEYPDYTSLKEL